MNQNIKSAIEKADALSRQGQHTSAYFALKRALKKEPTNAYALVVSAELYLRSGKQVDSEDVIKRLFELEPASFDNALQIRLGHVCFENDLLSRARRLFEWAEQGMSLDRLTLYRLGICLRRLGDMNSAGERLLACHKLIPDNPEPCLQLGHVHKALGNTDRAAHYYRQYIALTPTQKGTGYWCLADLKTYTFSDDEISAMTRELELSQENPPQASALHYALGSAAEKSKDYAAAMEHFDKGNLIQSKIKPFHTRQYRQIVAGLCNVPAEDGPVRRDGKPTPILIVGLPRSGTTLLEQILSAHSQVQATDELPFLERIALRLEMDGGYPSRLAAFTEEERRFYANQYVTGARDYLQQDCDYFIDKYPGNFLHIGLVKRILPDSIIIDARRDPRDVAISAYRQLFNVRNEFSATFDGIYEYYKGYLAMMEHWQSAYPDQIKTVRYEQLVSSPDEEIQALLDFCGLQSEPGCFEFYKQKRAVTTPSASQVSQPMYSSSIGQWRHYEAFTGDSMSRLGSLLAPAYNHGDEFKPR